MPSACCVKDPWFTLVAVVALGLGIGVNSTVFTFRQRRPASWPPFPERRPDRSREFAATPPKAIRQGVSYPDFMDWRAQARTFSSLAAYQQTPMNISDSGHPPERANGVKVSNERFQHHRRKVRFAGAISRTERTSQGAEPVAILGYGIWKTRYGSDPNVIGRSIRINDVADDRHRRHGGGHEIPHQHRRLDPARARHRHGAPGQAPG